ncbi:MAG: hypothetical protein HKO53_16780 [Gemmatimonadetes bacterium]|nr:hypothetical protein [Gemmatimonadota bacterium]
MSLDLQEFARSRPFELEAYEFVMRALDFTIQNLDETRHVSGQELVDGIREFAKGEFGPMAKHVLNTWGVRNTRDFGEIVFDLVAQGVLRKTEDDQIEDFENRFRFEVVFERDYYEDHPVLND